MGEVGILINMCKRYSNSVFSRRIKDGEVNEGWEGE